MIETKRLRIFPFNFLQLHKYIENDGSLELELNLNRSIKVISPELKDALLCDILPKVADVSKNYLFATLWTIVLKDENKMVGDLCFMGEPDENGQIEVGYGTYKEYQNKGIMTEALSGMLEWAKTQTNVKSIVAHTNNDNPASFAVLLKNNFSKIEENENLLKWLIQLP